MSVSRRQIQPTSPGLIVLLALLLAAPLGAPAQTYTMQTWAEGFNLPWSIDFLPDGTALVTEQGGRLYQLDADGSNRREIANVPAVYFAGQGGLFDVVVHPDFINNRWVYLSFAEGGEEDNGTAIARGRLEGSALQNVETVFRNFTRKDTPVHYGGRMAFLPDGTLLLTTGDGFDYREAAQDIGNGLGKLLRMNDDGTAATGNPFPESPYVYSYGHRNPQGLAVTGAGVVWLHEHGPRGGDELNRIEPGNNYGWPAITYGVDYSGAVISPYTEWEGMEQPLIQWTPAIAPSGLAVYEHDLFSEWRGNALVGGLVARELRRVPLSGPDAGRDFPLFSEIAARVRDVRVGPEGALFILTPDRVLRVVP